VCEFDKHAIMFDVFWLDVLVCEFETHTRMFNMSQFDSFGV
jgi:hypothetical protein